MRDIPASMQAQLDSGATTFCSCWRIDRKGGVPLGFTDHDESIEFDGVVFEASSGFSASAIERSLGLAIDNAAASGALRSARIDEEDIVRGRYDGAEVSLWQVDWTDPESRLLTFRGEIGEITRGALAFEAEIRGLSERLNRPVGRYFLPVCDAILGDGRCGVDIAPATVRGAGVVETVDDRRTFVVSGLADFQSDWFIDGALTWTGGANSGDEMRVRRQAGSGGQVRLEVDRDPVSAPVAGDAFDVIAGCNKTAGQCRAKFNNFRRFRGFPYIPGESAVAAYPVDGGVYDGGSRNGG